MSFLELRTPRDVLDAHWHHYLKAIESGERQPWLYPQATLGFAIVIIYLIAPNDSFLGSDIFRYSSWALAAWYHVWLILNTTSGSMSTGYGIGIISAFNILFTASLIIVNNAKRDFKRIESKSYLARISGSPAKSTNQSGPVNPTVTATDSTVLPPAAAAARNEYFWQSFPSSAPLRVRFDWVADLYSSFRGIGWTFQTSWVPQLPRRVQEQVRPADEHTDINDAPVSAAGIHRFDERGPLLRHSAWLLFKGYVGIDLIKTIMSRDRYFWGYIAEPAPSYLPILIRNSWALTRLYRLVVSMTGIWLVVRCIFTLAPLIFVGLFGSAVLGVRGEPWIYPEHWGSFSQVLDRGLAGYWGGWWHQTFRFAFTAFGSATLRTLGLDKQSAAGKLVGMFAVFIASGLLHASGSYTQIAQTNPLRSFSFFALQPVGLLAEDAVGRWLVGRGIAAKLPRGLQRVGRFLWTLTWLFFTAPLLVDDFARGGVWLWEPPGLFSIFRGPLRWGLEEEGVINWRVEWGRTFRWHTDPQGRWWMSGLAV